jgi:hypothetical protein
MTTQNPKQRQKQINSKSKSTDQRQNQKQIPRREENRFALSR